MYNQPTYGELVFVVCHMPLLVPTSWKGVYARSLAWRAFTAVYSSGGTRIVAKMNQGPGKRERCSWRTKRSICSKVPTIDSKSTKAALKQGLVIFAARGRFSLESGTGE